MVTINIIIVACWSCTYKLHLIVTTTSVQYFFSRVLTVISYKIIINYASQTERQEHFSFTFCIMNIIYSSIPYDINFDEYHVLLYALNYLLFLNNIYNYK